MLVRTLARAAAPTFCLVALAACGAPDSAPSGAAAPAASDAQLTAEEISEEMAELPPPYNEADYQNGRRVFAQCRSCHTIDEGAPHRVGPNLHGVFEREIGEAEGFNYSQAVQEADFRWTPEQLDHWLDNPQSFLPGNRMAFAGVRDETQRRDLIAYLMVETED